MRNNSFFNRFGGPVTSEGNGDRNSLNFQMSSSFSSHNGSAALEQPRYVEPAPVYRPAGGQTLVPRDMRLPGPVYLKLKRAFDIVVSLAALAVFGLFLPLLALLIKLDSPGPVFYSQERVGINRRQRHRRGSDRQSNDRRKVLRPGTSFRVHKIRSMRTDAEAKGAQWATKNDSRITRMGRFIRKTRIDELPQFYNVLKGEMSLIGPRPERLVFVHQLEKDIPDFRDRLLVKPGITGLAQVINGYDDSVDSARRKVELDKKYINSAGWPQDIKILASTVGVVIKGEGAH
jgi:lipopolysaccharide/colanic/teichoic acid biosynthesis glycosyltransferase